MASDMLITVLVKTKKYRVVERERLASILKERKLQMSGLVSQTTAVKIDKLIGVKYIITGAVTEYGQSKSGFRAGSYGSIGKKGYSSSVDVRAVNVRTGEIVFVDTCSGSKQSLSVSVLGFGGGESFDQKKASASMHMAIDEVAKKKSTRILIDELPRPSRTHKSRQINLLVRCGLFFNINVCTACQSISFRAYTSSDLNIQN